MKNWRSPTFDFLRLAPTYKDVIEFWTSWCNLKIRGLGAEWISYYFNFERNYDILKSKYPRIMLNKNINFNKNKTKSKMENPTHRLTLCVSSYKNCKLKVKLWWVEANERKKREFLVQFILLEEIFFNICILS